jgi:hypothetical protein
MTTHNQPWQSGPAELIRYALIHLYRESDFDRRIAFLLLDVGVETLFKTYLLLPEEVTGTTTRYPDRKAAAEGNFHGLVRGVKNASGSALASFNLAQVQYYHDLRNKLYHQGNGITVPAEEAKGYAQLATGLLKALLDVDLTDELQRPETEARLIAEQKAQAEKQEQEIRTQREAIEAARDRLGVLAAEAVERILPALALRSFERRFQEIVYECGQKQRFGEDCDFDGLISALLSSYLGGRPIALEHISDDLTEFRLGVVVAHLSEVGAVNMENPNWAGLYRLSEMYPEVSSQPTFIEGEQREIVEAIYPEHTQIVEAGRQWVSELEAISTAIREWLDRPHQNNEKV